MKGKTIMKRMGKVGMYYGEILHRIYMLVLYSVMSDFTYKGKLIRILPKSLDRKTNIVVICDLLYPTDITYG